MGIRKNAADISENEIEDFLNAIIVLKATKNAQGFSIYDQFVALHGAVMGVLTPTAAGNPVNFAHGNIGFLPWHRQYLLAFEQALSDALSKPVSIPYWNWSDSIGTANKLFIPEFLSTLRWGTPQDVSDGMLQFNMPSSERPSWWPAGLPGFRVARLLQEDSGSALERGSTEQRWPPEENWLNILTNVNQSINGRHPLWVFWLILEQGVEQLPQTHNAGHRFIGGHMGGIFSPNDPVFWLHHANVDRLWAEWQQKRIDQNLSANAGQTWPEASETSPFDGRVAPQGHKLGDAMWPWVDNPDQYISTTVSQAVQNRLPVFTNTVRVEDMLSSDGIDVSYQ